MQQSVVHAVAGTVGKGGNCGVGKKTGLRGDKPGEGYRGLVLKACARGMSPNILISCLHRHQTALDSR